MGFFVFICIIAIVILVINFESLKKENTELAIKLNRLEARYNDVVGKAYYNYLQINGINQKLGLNEDENRRVGESVRTNVVTGSGSLSQRLSNIAPVNEHPAPTSPVHNVPHTAARTARAPRTPLSDRLAGIEPVVNKPVNTAVHSTHVTSARTDTTVNTPAAPVQNNPVSPVKAETAADTLTDTSVQNNPVSPVNTETAADTLTDTPVQNNPVSPVKAETAADTLTDTSVQNNHVSSVKAETAADTLTDTSVQNNPVSSVKAETAADTSINTSVQNARLNQMPYAQPVNNRININPYAQAQSENAAYHRSAPVPKPTVRPKAAKKSEPMSVESWLGTRLFNIVASVLIFIGLILFCMLGYEYITDGMKIAAMHIVSLAFIGIGGYLTKKNRSVFSLGLTGCGVGASFISILLTHVYFHAINDITAFSLLFVWIILALFLSKKLDSLMLSITAHIGMAISVCFAFAMGFSADRIILPIIYQMASIAVIIIGNIICCKKTYRFGLFMSMGLLVYSSGVITSVLGKSGIVPFEVSSALAIAVYAAQFVALSFVSYLIAVSCNRLLTEEKNKYIYLPYFIHNTNKVLWSAGVIETVGSVVYILCRASFGITTLVYPSIAVCIATVCHLLVTLFMSEKLGFSEKLTKISMYFISCFVTVSLFIQATQRTTLHGMPLLFIYTGLVMLIRRYTRNKKLNHLISALIAAEMLYVAFYGYSTLGNVVISLLYLAMLGFMVLLHWFGQTGESRQKRFSLFKLAEFLWVCLSIIPINVSEFSDISLPLIISEFSLVAIIAYLTRYDEGNDTTLWAVVKIEAFASILAVCVTLSCAGSGLLGDNLAIRIVYFLMTVSLFVVYCYDFATSSQTAMQMLSSVLAAAYISAFCIGYGDKFAIASVYRDVLFCMPFFFITAVGAFVIYIINKNTMLSRVLLIPLGIDMLYMLTNGYSQLRNASQNSGGMIPFDIGFIGVLHFIIVSVMIYLLWHTQPEKEKQHNFITMLKATLYFWSMLAVSVITAVLSADLNAGSGYPWSFSIIFVIIINLAAIKLGCGKNRSAENGEPTYSGLELIIYTTASIVLYISMIFIAIRIKTVYTGIDYSHLEYSIRFAQIVTALGLFYLLSKEFLRSTSLVSHLAVCFTATLFVNAVCRGLPMFEGVMYVYSIASMVVALVCIIAGFVSKSKGMRMYGLILIMLCVLKLVTIDISSENSLSRVLAFVVGGIVCFIISGIYNFVERKIKAQTEIGESVEVTRSAD